MAYYGFGTKENILSNLESELNEISGINFVDYQRIKYSGVNPEDYPGCFINDVRVDKEWLLKDIVRNTFSVGIAGWIWAEEHENLSTKLNAFVETVKDKVREDPTRSRNAYDTKITMIETDGGSRHPQGLFIMILAHFR